MLKKLVSLAAIALISVLLLPTAAHASQYVVTDHATFSRPDYYHNRDTKTHYLWNQQHTRRLHNLKNYPHTTWIVCQTMLLQHGTHVARYYYVVSQNQRTAGWVWHGFLKDGTYRYQQLTTDGLHLTSALTFDDHAQLDRFALSKLQQDGYTLNNQLAIMVDYYKSNNLTPAQKSIADVVTLLKLKKLDPTHVAVVNLPAMTNFAAAIDPQHHNARLETSGKGQLGLQLVAEVEQALKAHHAATFDLQTDLTGHLTDGTGKLTFTLVITSES